MTARYWMHETGGALRAAIEAYLQHLTNPEAPDLTPPQVATIRSYFRQWIQGDWRTPLLDVLQTQVEEITTRQDIDEWLGRAFDEGIDPL